MVFPLVVGSLGQDLHGSHRHLHLRGGAVLVVSAVCASLMQGDNLVHALRNHAHGHGVLQEDALREADEQVGLSAHPLGSGLGLDTLCGVHAVAIVPRKSEIGLQRDVEVVFALHGRHCSSCLSLAFRSGHNAVVSVCSCAGGTF